MKQLSTDDIQRARNSLQTILAGIARGELAAGALLARGIGGAVATLTALLEEDSSPPLNPPKADSGGWYSPQT